MKPTVEEIGALLALKRDERPDADYWQDFLREFHQIQREQAKPPGMRNFLPAIAEWFSDLGPSKWAYGGGVAYAAVTVAFFLTPREAEKEDLPVLPVKYQVIPAPVPPTAAQRLDQVERPPATQGRAAEQVF